MTAWQLLALGLGLGPERRARLLRPCSLSYLALVRFRRTAQQRRASWRGWAVLLAGPRLAARPIGETYLFSVHMFQHLLLVLVVPPLLLLGLPAHLGSAPSCVGPRRPAWSGCWASR